MFKDYLNSYLQDSEIKAIFNSVIGTVDPAYIERLIAPLVQKYLHSKIEKIILLESSIGVVFGFLLADKSKIILKVYAEKISLSYLEQLNDIQTIFYQEKFPAPKVLSPIFSFDHTHAGFYEFIEGKKENAHQASIRDELAHYLAKFVEIVDRYKFSPLLNFFQLAQQNRLWPIPHNVLFDLKNTSRGAGWIAKKARAAKKLLQTSNQEKILAHTDWGIKNAIFKNGKLAGIFDWDSLGAMSELEMVGRAAAQFTADWDLGYKVTPSPEEGRAFVSAYEKYRGEVFSQQELHLVSAAADYLIATIARFEHAGNNPTQGPYQELLRECWQKSFLLM